jgi:hypothetical protein
MVLSRLRQLDPNYYLTHYADNSIKYDVPQLELEPFIKELASAQVETTLKLKIKNGVLPELHSHSLNSHFLVGQLIWHI